MYVYVYVCVCVCVCVCVRCECVATGGEVKMGLQTQQWHDAPPVHGLGTPSQYFRCMLPLHFTPRCIQLVSCVESN